MHFFYAHGTVSFTNYSLICLIHNLIFSTFISWNFCSVLQTTQRKSRSIVGKIRKGIERQGSGQKEKEKYDDDIDRDGDGLYQKEGKGEGGEEEGEMLMVMIEGIRELVKR